MGLVITHVLSVRLVDIVGKSVLKALSECEPGFRPFSMPYVPIGYLNSRLS